VPISRTGLILIWSLIRVLVVTMMSSLKDGECGAAPRPPLPHKPYCKEGSAEMRANADFRAAAERMLERNAPAGSERFARAVLHHLGSPPGAPPLDSKGQLALANRILHLLRSGGAAPSAGEPAFGAEAEFLSSVFQNMDLLYTDGFPSADRVAESLLERVWTSDGGHEGPAPVTRGDE
jgi:hypothetical protein